MATSSSSRSVWPTLEENWVFATLLGVIGAFFIVFLFTKTLESAARANHVGVMEHPAPTISVTAMGTSAVVPDIATVDLGVIVQADVANKAQEENAKKANQIIAALKGFGIDAKDIKTTYYNIYPKYDYNQSPEKLVGFEAQQTITVKIRKSELVSAVLQKSVELGANNVGNVRFEIDDATSIEAEARKEAIEKASTQAAEIARAMGVSLKAVVSYNESTGGSYPSPMYARADMAMGGGIAPEVATGESEVNMTVNITYAIE